MRSRVAIDIGGRFTDLVYLDAGAALDGVEFVVHGTTVGINTLSERTGAETALITTLGFRDVLEIGNGNGASGCRRSPPRSSAIPASSVARAPLIPGCLGC